MNSLLYALYDLLSFITKDAQAHKMLPNGMPYKILAKMNELCNELGEYLDETR
jgi:hypothetical protein